MIDPVCLFIAGTVAFAWSVIVIGYCIIKRMLQRRRLNRWVRERREELKDLKARGVIP